MGNLGDLAGRSFGTAPASWTRKDVLTYATSLGLNPEDPADLRFAFEGQAMDGPLVLPTFAVVASSGNPYDPTNEPVNAGFIGAFGELGITFRGIVHGYQKINIARPLPPTLTKGTVASYVTNVFDKGDLGGILEFERTFSDEHGTLFIVTMGVLILGAGNFGGNRGPSAKELPKPPERTADFVTEIPIAADLAARYRLNGDSNPLHVDPTFSVMVRPEYTRPILHGLGTYGIIGREVVRSGCADDPAKLGSFECRFNNHVFPRDTVRVEIWNSEDGTGGFVQALVKRADGDGTTFEEKPCISNGVFQVAA